jgi:hypothetical protein
LDFASHYTGVFNGFFERFVSYFLDGRICATAKLGLTHPDDGNLIHVAFQLGERAFFNV